jgi:hypothetical protein
MRETAKSKQAYADYLAMGPDRSLEKLLARYQSNPEAAPATNLTRLKVWSSKHGWQARLQAIADREAREAEEREAAYRRSIMEDGYALVHERVKSLQELAKTLFEELQDPTKRWCKDVKQIGSGESAEKVDIERFNAAEVDQFRGLLDDIAKELGERKVKQEITGKDGGPIEIDPNAGLADERRAARILELLKRAELRRADGVLPPGPSSAADDSDG